MPSFCFISFDFLFSNSSCFPNANDSIFTARHEVMRFTFIRISSVNFYATWNELDIRDEVFVWFFNCTHDQMLYTDSSLLATFIVFLIFLFYLLSTLLDSMLCWSQVPNYQLTINGSTNQYFGVLWMEFNARDFDWRLEGVLQVDYLTVLKIKYEDMWFVRLAHYFCPVIEWQVFYQTHCHDVRHLRMEFYTGDTFVLTIALLKESSWHWVDWICLSSGYCILIC